MTTNQIDINLWARKNIGNIGELFKEPSKKGVKASEAKLQWSSKKHQRLEFDQVVIST